MDEHPLDSLAEEQLRESSRHQARTWQIQLEEFQAAGFTREECMRMFVASMGRPPGVTAEDMERMIGLMMQSMKGRD